MIIKDLNIGELLKDSEYLYLVFNRGFKWPFCVKHMLQLQQDIEKFKAKGVKIIAVCPEKEDKVDAFIKKNNCTFDFLSDSDHKHADKYGQKVKLLKLGRMPAQILMDKDEKIIFSHFANNMKAIVENDEVLEKIKQIRCRWNCKLK